MRGTTCPDDFPLPKPLSLSAYAVQNPAKRGGLACWACSIPERAEIDEARRGGVSINTIRSWLITEKGYPEHEVTKGREALIAKVVAGEDPK